MLSLAIVPLAMLLIIAPNVWTGCWYICRGSSSESSVSSVEQSYSRAPLLSEAPRVTYFFRE